MFVKSLIYFYYFSLTRWLCLCCLSFRIR